MLDKQSTPVQDANAVGSHVCPTCGIRLPSTVTTCPNDNTPIAVQAIDDQNFVNTYEYLETIGTGGMGVIYKARHRMMNKLVAIKMIHSHLATSAGVQRFQAEARAASLLSHPNIVSIRHFDVTAGGQPYLVMDYLSGITLADELRQRGPLSMERFITIFSQVSSALAHAHQKSVLHRDIKPSNIMLITQNGSETAMLMDFGIAKIMSDTDAGALTKTGETIGSPMYMSPEQAKGIKADVRSDIYSLGCVMFESLAGTPPFNAGSALEAMMMHTSEPVPAIAEVSLGREVPPAIESLIRRCLAKDPAERIQTMESLGTALTGKCDAASLEAARPGRKEKNRALSKGTIFGITGIIVVLIASSVFFVHNASTKRAQSSAAPVAVAPAQTAPADPDDQELMRFSKMQGGVFPGLDDVKSIVAQTVLRQRREHSDTFDGRAFSDFGAGRSELELIAKCSLDLKKCILRGAHVHDSDLYLFNKFKLTELSVARSQIENVDALKLPSFADLTELTVSQSPITDTGLSNISKLRNLRDLDMVNCDKVTDEGLLKLKKCRRLRKLSVDDKSLSYMGVARLQGQLPRLKISSGNLSGKRPTEMEEFYGAHELMREAKYAQAMRALDDLERRIKTFPPLNTPQFQAELADMKGDCAVRLDKTRDAIALYSDAGARFFAANFYLEAAGCWSGVAKYLSREHDARSLAQAEKYLSKSTDAAKTDTGSEDARDVRLLVAKNSLTQSFILLEQNQTAEVGDLANDALSIYEECNDYKHAARCHEVLAQVCLRDKKLASAVEEYVLALRMLSPHGEDYRQTLKSYLALNKSQDDQSVLLQLQDLSNDEKGDSASRRYACSELIKRLKAQGKLDEATKYDGILTSIK